MFKELKKLAKTNPIYVKNENNNNYIYTYIGNTIAYYIDNSFVVLMSQEITSIVEYDNIEDAIANEGKPDDAPFKFEFDTESPKTTITPSNFVKAISQFTKFYNTEDYRTELTGLHIRKGTLFASDATIIRLKKTKTFPKDANMIIDVNPVIDYLALGNKKLKSKGKSLFAAKEKSDNLEMSTVTKDGNNALKLTHKNLTFVVISIGNSTLNFDYIKKNKFTHEVLVHRETLIKSLTELLNNPSTNSDAKKEMVRFTLKNKLQLSNYIYYKQGEQVINIHYTTPSEQDNEIFFVLNAVKLLTILKVMTNEKVIFKHDINGTVTRLTSEKDNNEDLLLIAQTTYK